MPLASATARAVVVVVPGSGSRVAEASTAALGWPKKVGRVPPARTSAGGAPSRPRTVATAYSPAVRWGSPPGRQQGPGRGGGRRPQGIARGADLEAAAAAGDHVEVRQADAGGRGIGPVGVARDGGGGGVRRSRDRSTAGDDRQTRTVQEGGLLRTGQEPAGAESQAEGGGDRAGRRRGRQHHPVAGLGDGGKGELEATTEIGAARIEPQGQGPRQGGGDRWNRHGATGRRQTVTVATDRRLAALPSPWQCIAIFRVRKGRRRHPHRGRRPPTLRGSDVTADGRGPRAGGRADDYEPLQR